MYETIIPIDYTTKDYEGFLQLMKEAIPTLLPEWTDLTESDFGIVLLQLASYGLHVLSFYQDKAVNENFLSTARNRESIVKLCRFLGYELAIQIPATTVVTFTKYADSLDTEITIPIDTKVTTDPQLGDVVFFETDDALTIAEGELSGSVAVTQGRSYKNEIIGIGDNTANQIITIEKENILIDNMTLYTIENNVKRIWTKVDDFLSSTAVSRHYKATIEGNYYTKITFGNGTNGMKVPLSTPIYDTYIIGGGVVGNVGAGKLNYLYDDIDGIETVSNAEAGVGGVDFESVERARVLAPKVYSTMNRAVTASDFEALAEGVTGVIKAKLVETFNANNDVYLYIIPSDYGTPSNALKTTVQNTIEDIMVLNNNLSVFSTEYVYYYVTATVEVLDSYENDEKKTEIESYLDTVLDPMHFSHGEHISESYVVGAIHKIEGVKKAAVNIYALGCTPTDEIAITDIQFLIPDTISVIVTGGI